MRAGGGGAIGKYCKRFAYRYNTIFDTDFLNYHALLILTYDIKDFKSFRFY